MERPQKRRKVSFDDIIQNIYNMAWFHIMNRNNLPNEDFECTCDDYCRYGCKHCRTGCYQP